MGRKLSRFGVPKTGLLGQMPKQQALASQPQQGLAPGVMQKQDGMMQTQVMPAVQPEAPKDKFLQLMSYRDYAPQQGRGLLGNFGNVFGRRMMK